MENLSQMLMSGLESRQLVWFLLIAVILLLLLLLVYHQQRRKSKRTYVLLSKLSNFIH